MKLGSYSNIVWGLIIPLVATVVFVDLSEAATWRVERDGSGNYTTIQPAVDGASPGDTILIGPGNYTEAMSIPFAGTVTDVFVNVTVADLTFIGTSPEDVHIGPEEYYPTFNGPIGFYSDETVGILRIENVSIQNVWDGCRSNESRMEVVGCRMENIVNDGILALSAAGLFVDQCVFVESFAAIVTFPPCTGVVVQNCEMVNSSIYVNGASDVVIENCHSVGELGFSGGSAGVQFDNSNGRVSNCEFYGHTSFSVGVISGSNVIIENSTLIADGLEGNGAGVLTRNNTSFVSVNNCIVSGSGTAFYLKHGSQASVENCDISTTGPWLVYSIGYDDAPIELDFTNNYWGTTDRDVIASKIHDSNDDENLNVTIIFEPFAGGPLPTESMTLDGLKALFR